MLQARSQRTCSDFNTEKLQEFFVIRTGNTVRTGQGFHCQPQGRSTNWAVNKTSPGSRVVRKEKEAIVPMMNGKDFFG